MKMDHALPSRATFPSWVSWGGHRALRAAVLVSGAWFGASPLALVAQQDAWPVDLDVIANIREEGLQRSQLPNTLSYMTDVLGARLTNSDDMERAQLWVLAEMDRIGLTNTAREPFMDYGVSWDNEYVSLHMLEPDYTPLVGYPIAHTPGTDGKQPLTNCRHWNLHKTLTPKST